LATAIRQLTTRSVAADVERSLASRSKLSFKYSGVFFFMNNEDNVKRLIGNNVSFITVLYYSECVLTFFKIQCTTFLPVLE
jgi:hypothetical protein